MELRETGVATGAVTSSGGAGLVRTTLAGLFVQPPSAARIGEI